MKSKFVFLECHEKLSIKELWKKFSLPTARNNILVYLINAIFNDAFALQAV